MWRAFCDTSICLFVLHSLPKHWLSRRCVGSGNFTPIFSLRIGQKRAVTSDSSRRANSVTEGTAESLAASIRPKRKTVAVAVSS